MRRRAKHKDHVWTWDFIHDTKGLRVGALTRDAIAQFLIPQEEWRQTLFRLDGREHLRQVKVAQTNIVGYSELLMAGGVQ